jgi:hypothetical protein
VERVDRHKCILKTDQEPVPRLVKAEVVQVEVALLGGGDLTRCDVVDDCGIRVSSLSNEDSERGR